MIVFLKNMWNLNKIKVNKIKQIILINYLLNLHNQL